MKKGFTLVEIMIVAAIIGLLAAIAIPSFMRARTTSQRNVCINNLRQIEAAKNLLALEQGLTNGASLGSDAIGFGLIGPSASGSGSILVAAGTKFSHPPTSGGPAPTLAGGGYIKVFPNCPASTNLGSKPKSAAISAQDYALNPVGSNATCLIVPLTHVLP